MDLMTLLIVWCGIHFNSVSICHSGSNPLCEVSVDVNGTTVCYWVIMTEQNVTSSEAKCKLDNGTLGYIPNEATLLEASAFVAQQLGIGTFVYIGYTRTIQAFIQIRGTATVQTWVAWDAAFSQPNSGGECVAMFTQTGKFHDIPCTEKFYALCSTTFNSTDVTTDTTTDATTDVTTDVITDATTDVTTDVTTYVSTDVTTDVNTDVTTDVATDYTTDVTFDVTSDVTTDFSNDVTTDITTDATVDNKDASNITACHCSCDAKRSIVIYPIVNISKALQAKLDTLKKDTEVNEEMLSSTIRARTSASDPRPSSAYVGYLGIALLVVIFGGILLVDLPRLSRRLKCDITSLV